MTAFPKPKPRLLERTQSRTEMTALDKAESQKVKARSKGRCEVTVRGWRCLRRAFEVHHHIGGWKLRGRGESALAANKTHCCTAHHREITGNVLEHIRGNDYREIQ